MNEDTGIFIKISEQLGKLNGNMESVLDQLSQHNLRISNLEKSAFDSQHNLKDSIVRWLVIALISSICIISTLTGSSALLTKILF